MKIVINEPCHENWDNMKPNDKGAFCLSCQKNVVDFSSKTIDEVKSFFNELPSSNNVCGRFKEAQLTEMSFDHFLNEFMNWKFFKKAAVIFYFIFGVTVLSSCSSTNDDHKAGELIVIQDTTKTAQCVKDTLQEGMITGEPALIKDTVKKQMSVKDNNKLGNNINKHLLGGPSVVRDTIKKVK